MSLFKKRKETELPIASSIENDWFRETEEGQLSVDVFRKGNFLIVRSTMAGVSPDHLDIALNGDLLTIRGQRESNYEIKEDEWFHQECYWGGFSRSIILPVDVQEEKIKATIRNGILTIELPKAKKKDINIKVKDDN